MAGQSAYDCEQMSKEDLVQEALETLALIYPEKQPIPTPLESMVTRWSHDEFAQGSYSFVGREGTGDDYDLLAKSIDDQLYFAGEATSRHYPATAHGAYLSGLKVAKEIIDSLIGPQVVRSDRRESLMATNEEVEYGDTEMEEQHDSNHLFAVDSHSMDSPSSQPAATSLLMSLEREFVIPRRRGRVSQSMMAQFVAELSDSSDGSDTGSEMDVSVEPRQVKTHHISKRLRKEEDGAQESNGYHIDCQSSVAETKTAKRHHSSLRAKRKART